MSLRRENATAIGGSRPGNAQNDQTSALANREAGQDAAFGGSMGRRWTYTLRGYAVTQSWRQLRSRPLASGVTLFVLGITLALPVLLWFCAGSLQQLGKRTLDQESLTAYLSPDIDDLQGAELARALANRPGVRESMYVSRAEALDLLRQHTDVDDVLETLENNPLPGAVVIHPARDSLTDESMDRLASTLADVDGVERVQVDLEWVRRLQAVVSLLQLVGILLGSFLVLTALLVIGNTVRLELLRREAEMEVAHLLGAATSFRHRPLVYTGALYGFLGGLVACVLAIIALLILRQPADQLANLYGSSFRLKFPSIRTVGFILAIATMLGLAGTVMTLAKPSSNMFRSSRNH